MNIESLKGKEKLVKVIKNGKEVNEVVYEDSLGNQIKLGDLQTKVVKLKICKPLEKEEKEKSLDWKTLGKIMNDFNDLGYKVKNNTINQYHPLKMKIKDYYYENGNKAMDVSYQKEHLFGGKSDRAFIYSKVMEDLNKKSEVLNNFVSEPFSGLVGEAMSGYNKLFSDIWKGKSVIPTFSRNQPIPIRERNFDILDVNTLRLRFLSKTGGEYYGVEREGNAVPIDLIVKSKKGHAKKVMRKIMSGDYIPRDSKIQITNEGIFFLLHYKELEVKQVALDKDKILGIDLGIVNALTLAVGGEYKYLHIKGGEITEFRNRVEKRRVSKRNQLRVASDNRFGHGRNTLLRPLDTMSNKISNFKDLTNHRYSKKVVEFAIKNGCGTIQMEDLTGISKNNLMLKTWSYYDLQQKIEYKAKEFGIEVIYVKPKYTSLRCSKCGCIHEDNRLSQEKFKCQICGEESNADLNAARNISIKDIDVIIQEQLDSNEELLKKLNKLKRDKKKEDKKKEEEKEKALFE